MVKLLQKSLFGIIISFLFCGVVWAHPKDKTFQVTGLSLSYARFRLRTSTLESAFLLPRENIESYLSFEERRKSRGRAFLQSLLLPGWGQHYAGSRTMMKMFIASEAILLGSFVWFRARSNWLEDDYRTFAASHAGVRLQDKNDRFFVDIGNFDNTSEYNQAQLRDRDLSSIYPETAEFFWQWDSIENRDEFDDIRTRSDRAQNRSELTLAFLFLNHLGSAIHSTLAIFKFNKRLEQSGLGFDMHYKQIGSGYAALQVEFHKKF